MKKNIYYFLFIALLLPFLNSCKSKLLGYNNDVTLPVEKKCTVASVYDSIQQLTFNYSYDKDKKPLKAVSSESTDRLTFEYDGKRRWSKYLQEKTDSANTLYSLIYNDTTNLISEVNQYYYGYSSYYLNGKIEFSYDSLDRVVLVKKYSVSEGIYLEATYRLEYNKNGNISKQYVGYQYNNYQEYLQIEYTEYDNKVNFASLNHNFQILDPMGINNIFNEGGEAFIPNFSKNNPLKANFYVSISSTAPSYTISYNYIYSPVGLPVKNSILFTGMSEGNEFSFLYTRNASYTCPN